MRLKHEPELSLSGLRIDPAHRKVYCDDREISLTAKEYDLLCLLAANKVIPFSSHGGSSFSGTPSEIRRRIMWLSLMRQRRSGK